MARQLLKFERTSPLTNVRHVQEIWVDPADMQYWLDGGLIQDALPYLTPAEREFIMTGITEYEWDRFFPDEDDDTPFRVEMGYTKEESERTRAARRLSVSNACARTHRMLAGAEAEQQRRNDELRKEAPILDEDDIPF